LARLHPGLASQGRPRSPCQELGGCAGAMPVPLPPATLASQGCAACRSAMTRSPY
jgi:hypothetical protein